MTTDHPTRLARSLDTKRNLARDIDGWEVPAAIETLAERYAAWQPPADTAHTLATAVASGAPADEVADLTERAHIFATTDGADAVRSAVAQRIADEIAAVWREERESCYLAAASQMDAALDALRDAIRKCDPDDDWRNVMRASKPTQTAYMGAPLLAEQADAALAVLLRAARAAGYIASPADARSIAEWRYELGILAALDEHPRVSTRDLHAAWTQSADASRIGRWRTTLDLMPTLSAAAPGAITPRTEVWDRWEQRAGFQTVQVDPHSLDTEPEFDGVGPEERATELFSRLGITDGRTPADDSVRRPDVFFPGAIHT